MKQKHLVYFCGPNRRSESTAIEMLLAFTAVETEYLAQGLPNVTARLMQALERLEIATAADAWPDTSSDSPLAGFGERVAATALALQAGAGHRVEWRQVLAEKPGRCTVLFEHEDSLTGEPAGRLALDLVAAQAPGLEWRPADGRPLPERLQEFRRFAGARVLPRDAAALEAAAKRRSIPVIKLERDPYEGVEGAFRIRRNSMLMLGQARHRQIVDGTFAIQKSQAAAPLLFDRARCREALMAVGLPVPLFDRDCPVAVTTRHARRVAERLGFPVAVRPARRSHGRGLTLHVAGPESLAGALEQARRLGEQILIERQVPGEAWQVLVAGHSTLVVFRAGEPARRSTACDPGLLAAAEALSRRFGVGLLALTVISPDIERPLSEVGGAVVDLDVAPRLDRLCLGEEELLERAAAAFVDWLLPEPAAARLPVFGVTGTNGKTTTSRMLAAILSGAGRCTGLVCTDAIYVDGVMQEKGDQASLKGHYRIFEDPRTEAAVLECHHQGIATLGFAVREFDVGVCINVTDDHIGEWGIGSVAEMAGLKRALPERSAAVVLNADDPHCLAMADVLSGKRLCLFSGRRSASELLAHPARPELACVIEWRDGSEWIVLHGPGEPVHLMPVADIPATFGGAARFNLANAQAAASAATLFGIPANQVAGALGRFAMSADATPGRQNVFDKLPFKVMVDFAHNPDGIRRLAEFVSRLPVEGRRTLVYSAWKSESFVRDVALAPVDVFDRYVCKNYQTPEEYGGSAIRGPENVPAVMRAALIEAGIAPERIETVDNELDAVRHALDTSEPGDLVVWAGGYFAIKVFRSFLDDYAASYRKHRQP